jgi:hypothetical protein
MSEEKTLLQLTPDQEKIVEKTKNEWIQFILNGGDEIDEKELKTWGKWLYTNKGFKAPKIHIGDSPKHCQEIANKLAGNEEPKWYNFSHESLGQSGGWVTYVDLFVKLDMFQNEEFTNYSKFLKSGVFLSLTFDTDLIVCRRPLYTKLNDKFELHSTDSPAMAWRDGFKLYFLNGVKVTEEIVMTPADKLNPMLIMTEKNAEVRRELVRKIGIARFIKKYGGVTLDTWEKPGTEYKLLKLKVEGMRTDPLYLVMRNPSIGVYYAEGVHPDCKTVKEALAWRDGEDNYIEPDVLT